MFRTTGLWRQIAPCLVVLATTVAAQAVEVKYTYIGATDPECTVQGIGLATCDVTGWFAVDTAIVGLQQPARAGIFTLMINGARADEIPLLADPDLGTINECTDLCNQVALAPSGEVETFRYWSHPPGSVGEIVQFQQDGWSWSGLLPDGRGIYSGTDAATITGPTPAPLPMPALALLSCFLVLTGLNRRAAARKHCHFRVPAPEESGFQAIISRFFNGVNQATRIVVYRLCRTRHQWHFVGTR